MKKVLFLLLCAVFTFNVSAQDKKLTLSLIHISEPTRH